MDEHKITYLSKAEDTNKKPGTLVDTSLRKYNNYGGGGGNMDKYVTHQELNTATAKIKRLMDALILLMKKLITYLISSQLWLRTSY